MKSKKELYVLLGSMLDSNLITKEEMLEVFINILKDNFSINEMFGLASKEYGNSVVHKKENKNTDEIMSYPSVVGIPVSVIYEKLFKK